MAIRMHTRGRFLSAGRPPLWLAILGLALMTAVLVADSIWLAEAGAPYLDSVSQGDSSLPNRAVWPYQGDPPAVPRQGWGRLSYLPPDPASGIDIAEGYAYGAGAFIHASNGLSTMHVDGLTGLLFEGSTRIALDDQFAFDEFYSTVRISHGDGTTLEGQFSSKPGAWPYSGQPDDGDTQQWGRVTYIAPDPASGLAVIVRASMASRPGGCQCAPTHQRAIVVNRECRFGSCG